MSYAAYWGLLVLLPVVAALTVAAPLYYLLLLDLGLAVFSGQWHVGIFFDESDVIFAALAFGVVARGRGALSRVRERVPYLNLWLLFGVLVSLSFLAAPATEEYPAGLANRIYQLYRYCWKAILYYPLAALMLYDGKRAKQTLNFLIVAGLLIAIQAIPAGYGGARGGVFLAANALGSALLVPILLCITWLLTGTTRWQRVGAVVSIAVLIRAVLFSGSRGAFVALAVGVLVLVSCLWTQALGRARLLRVVAALFVLSALVLALKPDLLERPTVARVLTLSEGAEVQTFQWRREQRWPHFWKRAWENPWLGKGTDGDPVFGDKANTPHSGYLSTAVRRGFPLLGVLLVFCLLTLKNSLSLVRRARTASLRVLGACICAAIISLLTHNVVDDVLTTPFVGNMFWILVAFAACARRRVPIAEESSPRSEESDLEVRAA